LLQVPQTPSQATHVERRNHQAACAFDSLGYIFSTKREPQKSNIYE
jgi:hypothetical protein